MPVLASTTTLLARTKNIILLSLAAFTVAVLTTYVVIKAVKLYREHLQTEGLARKVWDAEARRIKEEEEEIAQQQQQPKATKQHTPDKSIVPSLPPVAYVGTDDSHHRWGKEPERLFDGRLATLISPVCVPTSWCARYADGSRPFKEMLIAPLGIHLAVGHCSHMEFDRPAPPLRGHSSTLDNKPPHQTATALAADQQHWKVIAGRHERRALSPLSAAEVERRRCLPREARRNAVGKENVGIGLYNLAQQSIPCASRNNI